MQFFTEETASAQAGALYKPMAKLSASVMEEKIKTELVQPKLVCIWFYARCTRTRLYVTSVHDQQVGDVKNLICVKKMSKE